MGSEHNGLPVWRFHTQWAPCMAFFPKQLVCKGPLYCLRTGFVATASDLVVPWSRGPVVPWSRGPVDPWTRGPGARGPRARGPRTRGIL